MQTTASVHSCKVFPPSSYQSVKKLYTSCRRYSSCGYSYMSCRESLHMLSDFSYCRQRLICTASILQVGVARSIIHKAPYILFLATGFQFKLCWDISLLISLLAYAFTLVSAILCVFLTIPWHVQCMFWRWKRSKYRLYHEVEVPTWFTHWRTEAV